MKSFPRITGVRLLNQRFGTEVSFNAEVDLKAVRTELDAYQRNLDQAHVDAIAGDGYCAAAWRDPILSYREGKLFIVEGNHELNASLQRNKNVSSVVVNAVVYFGLTIEKEAQMFNLINGGRKRQQAWQNLHANIIARDPKTLQILSIVTDSRLKTPLDGGSEIELRSVRVLTEAYKRSASHLQRLLNVLRRAWRLDYGRLQVEARTVEMQRGLSLFLGKHVDLSVNDVVKELRKTQNSAAVVNAEALKLARQCSKARGDAAQVCKALEEIFGIYGSMRLAA